MALEALIFQDPFLCGYNKDYISSSSLIGGYGPPSGFQEEKPSTFKSENLEIINGGEQCPSNSCIWESPPSSIAHNTSSSPENCIDGFFTGGGYPTSEAVVPPPAAGRRKRRRTKTIKNKEEMENQRMTHIAVERNRRRQMNDYLAVLRSLMPPSYAQRGDQASIVGGAINFVKELEQLVQFLESHQPSIQTNANPFSNFFTFPQYTTSPSTTAAAAAVDVAAERRSGIADIEVMMFESHANIKILSKRWPKQLLKMVVGFQSIFLTILHLNVTTVDQSVLYSFSVKVEDECQVTTVNEIATAVHDMVGMIQEETMSS